MMWVVLLVLTLKCETFILLLSSRCDALVSHVAYTRRAELKLFRFLSKNINIWKHAKRATKLKIDYWILRC